MNAQTIAQPLVSTALVAVINKAPDVIGLGVGLGYSVITQNTGKGIQIWNKFGISETTTKSVTSYAFPTLAIGHGAEILLKDTPLMKDRKTKELTKLLFFGGVNLAGALILKKPLKDAALLTVAEYAAISAKNCFFGIK